LTVFASIALLCAGAMTLIVMTLTGADSDDSGARAMLTALTAVFFLLAATAGATLSRSRADLAWFGFLASALSLGALAGTVIAIWGNPGEEAGKAIGVAAVLALAAAHASIMLGPRYRDSGDRIQVLRNATLAMLALLAGLIVYAILSEDAPGAKLIAILAILYALGSLVLPIAQRSQGRTAMLKPLETPDGSAADLLRANGYVLVDGPRPVEDGEWTRVRAPDGRLVDVTAYGEGAAGD
jgi:hypothetical protein